MSKKTQLNEIWRAFAKYCREDKTRWDVKDYSKGFLLVFGSLFLLTWVAVVFANAN